MGGRFAKNADLRLLNANDNLITELSMLTFKGLGNLHTLSLARNKLTELKQGVFVALDKLINLHLSSNEIARVYANVWPVNADTNYFALGYDVDLDDSNQKILRTLSMRYNPTDCFSGIKDFKNQNIASESVNIFRDFGVQCRCARGYQAGPGDDNCIPRQCPAFPTQAASLKQTNRVIGNACASTKRSYQDTCTVRCNRTYSDNTVTYTCNAAGQWVSEDLLECSASNRIRVEPIVIGESITYDTIAPFSKIRCSKIWI